MNRKWMWVIIAVLLFVVVVIGGGTETDAPEVDQVVACRAYAYGMESLYLEADYDLSQFALDMADYYNGDISEDKLVSQIRALTDAKEQRLIDYQRLIDLYMEDCDGGSE